MILGRIEVLVALGILVVLFWLQFYFVWIGVHWLRWLWGGRNLFSDFCLLIWALRDGSAVETIMGAMNMLVGAALCSPSVYLFAKRQKETVRWKESLLIGAAAFLSLVTVASGGIAVWALREQYRGDARTFADEASEHIYRKHDEAWAIAHVSEHSLQQNGAQRLRYFFANTARQLGAVQEIRHADAVARLRLRFPFDLEVDAKTAAHAETEHGPVELDFLLVNTKREWRIDHMWWNYLPLPPEQQKGAP